MLYIIHKIKPITCTHAVSNRFCLHLDEYLASGRNDTEVMMPRWNAISKLTAQCTCA